MTAHAYQVYRQTQVSTASPGELLLMLFDGAIRFARQAQEHISKGELEAANSKLIRVQDIISELNLSLDLSVGEIAQNLQQLYTYIYDRLVEANIKKDPEIVDEAIRFLVELRDTWEQVVCQVR